LFKIPSYSENVYKSNAHSTHTSKYCLIKNSSDIFSLLNDIYHWAISKLGNSTIIISAHNEEIVFIKRKSKKSFFPCLLKLKSVIITILPECHQDTELHGMVNNKTLSRPDMWQNSCFYLKMTLKGSRFYLKVLSGSNEPTHDSILPTYGQTTQS
jgi:hypothetical protein